MKQTEVESEAFRNDWQTHYSSRLPLAWELREEGILPWARFHFLPESKHWPTNAKENKTVLERADVLGNAVLGLGSPCWHVECLRADDPEIQKGAVSAGFVAQVFSYEWNTWIVFVSSEIWKSSETRAKRLIEIARDETWPHSIFWMSKENGQIFAPYDGGFDLFLKSKQDVAHLRAKHENWLPLPSHPGGM
ncbi:hypothetical protein [Rhizobium sp. Leaf386]|uniref:DUF3885 domain-containing protein n=1 Tax=Rhizobium sp. Leaf386 TaxID=1736359 RepID=UPI000715E5F3|nr:hypothetical protein [Rhizobium sp. Leaf386]KQS95372.1 hypothetical protein ASG50_25440 [Rhizobium sp. Leaf386]